MKPRSTPRQTQMDLSRAHFDQILNPNHPLITLSETIDWERFDAAFAECYCPDFGQVDSKQFNGCDVSCVGSAPFWAK